MTDMAKPLWSSSGRGDLKVIRSLGANAVRLQLGAWRWREGLAGWYGNNPELQHGAFLDEAQRNGLLVIPGMSDFPYTQDPHQSCVATNYNCFSQAVAMGQAVNPPMTHGVKKQYMENLKNGFLKDHQYHPALPYFILVNEPDLKIPETADSVLTDSQRLAKAIISAFDAVLDAEHEAKVTGSLINFTATFSYAICQVCPENQGLPALGQMRLVRDAMMNPQKYGYAPKHPLHTAYLQRWVNSFNTANEAADLHSTFFAHYKTSFPTMPVFIGEYHSPQGPPVQEQVSQILHLANEMPGLFLGINFFEFQVSYWKGGSEMNFGLFGLGGYPVAHFKYVDGGKYTSWCLAPQAQGMRLASASNTVFAGTLMPEALAQAYGGHSPSASQLCLPQAETVPISTLGYNLMLVAACGLRIVGLKDLDKASAFIDRVATHMGARCVADRTASEHAVEKAISWGCAQLVKAGKNCEIDSACQSAFQKGDWVFSRYYQSMHKDANALEQCNFGGAAQFLSPRMYHKVADPSCVAD
eukprot:Skav217088  [mRNA]  locus=scaffold2169:219485:225031:- [translate_table: standard]